MKKLDDFRLKLGNQEYLPLMIGGMGMDISTANLVLAGAREGGIVHLSDALVSGVADRHYGTTFVKDRFHRFKDSSHLMNKSFAQFELEEIRRAVKMLVENTMAAKRGQGGIFINIMEKLSMNNPKETLKVRLNAALDAGIEGISLAAGLHLGSFALMQDNPRFKDAKLGIIVSSLRALQLFLAKSKRTGRLPDYVVVEGPLAGGHLGFKLDNWMTFDLKSIVQEILDFVKKENLPIAVIPAGGIFTGTDASAYMEMGSGAVQVATRLTITEECGLPSKVKQRYFRAEEEEIEVNMVSPTGYPMRMLKDSPCIGTSIRPQCESLGYLLDADGYCSYIEAYEEAKAKAGEGGKVVVYDKTCLCNFMKAYGTWTCGHMTYRLKETTNLLPGGVYQELTVKDVFYDYLHSSEQAIIKPPLPPSFQEGNQ